MCLQISHAQVSSFSLDCYCLNAVDDSAVVSSFKDLDWQKMFFALFAKTIKVVVCLHSSVEVGASVCVCEHVCVCGCASVCAICRTGVYTFCFEGKEA